ncbi:hypothetical protein ACPV5L_10250 [Vibrio astriarenae]|jgi:uncharacterized protein YegL
MYTQLEEALQAVQNKNAATQPSASRITGVLPMAIVIACNQHHQGQPVLQINTWLEKLICQLQQQHDLVQGLELAVLAAHDYTTVHQPLTPLENLSAIPLLAAKGNKVTLAQSIDSALSMLLTRIEEFKHDGIKAKRPWMLIVTDRVGTDFILDTQARLEKYKNSFEVIPFVLNFGDFAPDLERLTLGSQITVNLNDVEPINAWLELNLLNVLRTKQGQVQLTAPPRKRLSPQHD